MEFRKANAGDLGLIIEMLADDTLGAGREQPDPEQFQATRRHSRKSPPTRIMN